MTEPSQYFKGRTVQEQMDEVIGYVDQRSAEVAVNAIASDVAQVHQDMLDADADASAAAASAAAAAGTLANAVKKTGEASQSIAGDIAVAGDLSAGGLISGTRVEAPTPVFDADAANKKYVDDADATKISITAINSYAVGLTDNQGPIAGAKNFTTLLQRIYQANTHIVQTIDLTGGEYSSQLVAVTSSTVDVNLFFMWHNTRKGITPQVSQCGFISAGFRPSGMQIASICGQVPTNQFAITRRVVDGQNEYRLWSTGQIKNIDIMYEGIGANNVQVWARDKSPITSSNLSTYDEVKYL